MPELKSSLLSLGFFEFDLSLRSPLAEVEADEELSGSSWLSFLPKRLIPLWLMIDSIGSSSHLF
jgi:hypothetical protein